MINSILLPIDLGHESSWSKAAPTAVSLAKMHEAKIHVISVIPDFGMPVVGSFFSKEFSDDAVASSEAKLQELVVELVPSDVLSSAVVAQGTIYREIMKAANSLKCDLIVLASHSPENADYLLGPNAARVARHAQQSVYVVRPD